jgi:hypothetical protein
LGAHFISASAASGAGCIQGLRLLQFFH